MIGFDEPFCIIGERINPTGRKLLMAEMAAGDYARVEKDALAQVAAGAHMLDVNAGVPLADEPRILADCIKLVQSLVDVPLSIDSSIVAALEAGLEVYQGKPLLNSVTGEEERLESVLPLVKKHGCAVVAISNDESGISEDPDERFAIAKKIVERAMDHGIPREDVVVDPLVMPIGAINSAGVQAFAIMRRLKEELGVNSTCGASEHRLRPAQPAERQRGLPLHGGALGPDLGHHEPAARGRDRRGHGRRHDERQRPRLRALASPLPRTGGRERRRGQAWPARGAPAPAGRAPPSAREGMSEPAHAFVVFTPSGKRGRFPLGTSVLDAARALGVDLDSVCGGRVSAAAARWRPAPATSPSSGSRARRST